MEWMIFEGVDSGTKLQISCVDPYFGAKKCPTNRPKEGGTSNCRLPKCAVSLSVPRSFAGRRCRTKAAAPRLWLWLWLGVAASTSVRPCSAEKGAEDAGTDGKRRGNCGDVNTSGIAKYQQHSL